MIARVPGVVHFPQALFTVIYEGQVNSFGFIFRIRMHSDETMPMPSIPGIKRCNYQTLYSDWQKGLEERKDSYPQRLSRYEGKRDVWEGTEVNSEGAAGLLHP